MSTFVSVGNASQPFSRMLDEVARLLITLPQPVVVQHGSTPFHADSCRAIPFVEMREFVHLVESAELLILHAGAGSVIHAVRAGKVPVVIPRLAMHGEHIDDHQIEFAQAMASSGRVVVSDPAQICNAVKTALLMQRGWDKVSTKSTMPSLIKETLSKYARCYE